MNISVFRQQPYLKRIFKELSGSGEGEGSSHVHNGDPHHNIPQVCKDLHEILNYLTSSAHLVMVQTAASHQDFLDQLQCGVFSTWDACHQRSPEAGSADNLFLAFAHESGSFPEDSHNVLLTIPGVESSFLMQGVQCAVQQTDEDYYPVLLLTELLSRTEGPLWEKIRGRGYAYGADIFFAPSWGHLWSSIHESSSPAEALDLLHEILHHVDEYLNDFNIAAAKSSLFFRRCSQRATPSKLLSRLFQERILGIPADNHSRLFQVTKSDLSRVFQAYFSKFFEGSGRISIVVANPTKQREVLEKFSGQHPDWRPAFGGVANFLERDVDSLMIPFEREEPLAE